MVTLRPRDFKSRAMEDVATPFPIPEITPPEIKITLVLIKKHPLGVPAYILPEGNGGCQEAI